MKLLKSGINRIGIAPERIFRFGKEDNFWNTVLDLAVHVLRFIMIVAKSMAAESQAVR